MRSRAVFVAVLASALGATFGTASETTLTADGAISAAFAAEEPDRVRVETARFVITTEGSEAEATEWGRVLEDAWPQMEAYLRAAPALAKGERLRIRFFEKAETMRAAIVRAGGVDPGGAGGYYCPVAKTSYAFRQPSVWWTRALVIHETLHAFHMRGAAAKAKGLPGWWVEGVAEHLSHHTWDGERVRLGVVPMVSLEDYPKRALEGASAKGFSPASILAEPLDRPRAMHLVRYLSGPAAAETGFAWPNVMKNLNAGVTVSPRDLSKAFGGSTTAPAAATRFADWLRTVQQPLVSEFVEWDSRGADAVRGSGAVVAIARTRGPVDEVAADVVVAGEPASWRAGLLLRWTGPRDYVLGYVENGTSVFIDELAGGAWKRHDAYPLPAASKGPVRRMSATWADGSVRFLIDGTEVAKIDGPRGPLGFEVDHCTADFRGITIR